MTDYRLPYAATMPKAERCAHIAHKQAIARSIAVAIDAEMPLVDWEQRFLRFVLSETGATDDHAGALRNWANSYTPGKRRGPGYTFCAIDAAEGYALYREEGRSHTAALQLLAAEIGVERKRLREAIPPFLQDVCAHLGIPLEVASERKPPGRPRNRK